MGRTTEPGVSVCETRVQTPGPGAAQRVAPGRCARTFGDDALHLHQRAQEAGEQLARGEAVEAEAWGASARVSVKALYGPWGVPAVTAPARRGVRARARARARARGGAHLPTRPTLTVCPSVRYFGSWLRTTSSRASSNGTRYSVGERSSLARRRVNAGTPSRAADRRSGSIGLLAPSRQLPAVERAQVVGVHQQTRLLASHHLADAAHIVALAVLWRASAFAAVALRFTHVRVQELRQAPLVLQPRLRGGVHGDTASPEGGTGDITSLDARRSSN